MTTQLPESTPKASGRSSLLIFLGFLLLGAVLALVLFGGAIFGGQQPTANDALSILDQVPDFATSVPGVAQTGGLGGSLTSGDTAPDFALQDLDGNRVTLAEFRGRPVLVNFWATWCAPCRVEMPELQAAYDQHQEEGLVILALNVDEPAEIARAYFYDEMGLTFTPLLDEGGTVAALYGAAFTLPASFFIDPDGVVTAVHRGPMTREQIGGYLAEM